MALPSEEYVELLLKTLYPYADVLVTTEPDGLYLEISEASFSFYVTISDEHSPFLAVFEQILVEGTA